MKNGIVIHHGSVPLSVRYLIEKFTNAGYARICFATSTLAQGVNMPFDLVWVDNLRFSGTNEDKTLGLKNLIGRAGRSSQHENYFDYGFVVVSNPNLFIKRFNGKAQLSDISQLEENSGDLSEDIKEYVDSIKNNTLNENYSLPQSKVERLNSEEARNIIQKALDLLFKNGKIISGEDYRAMNKDRRDELKIALQGVFEKSLGRELFGGEKAVLSTSISILLWQIQGKSFKELLGLRFSYLTRRDEQNNLINELKRGNISEGEYQTQIDSMQIRFSPIPNQLPKASLRRATARFPYTGISEFNYDLLVYDTYDFIDKVISFSLSDVYISAFDQFYNVTNDERALAMVNYFRYGTNDEEEIYLLRYGFSFEDIEQIKEHVSSIDENEIVFWDTIEQLNNKSVMELIEFYK
jgi:hypothetical protein